MRSDKVLEYLFVFCSSDPRPRGRNNYVYVPVRHRNIKPHPDQSKGARAWELLRQFGDSEKVVAELLDEYDVSEERLRMDLEALLGDLCTAQLLEKEDAPPS